MNGVAVLLVAATLGVDYGWEPTESGELEYIIQLEPALLDALREGFDVTSSIHPDVRGVKRFRIHVGSGEVPRIGAPAADTSPSSSSAQRPPTLSFPSQSADGSGGSSAVALRNGGASAPPSSQTNSANQYQYAPAAGSDRSAGSPSPFEMPRLPPKTTGGFEPNGAAQSSPRLPDNYSFPQRGSTAGDDVSAPGASAGAQGNPSLSPAWDRQDATHQLTGYAEPASAAETPPAAVADANGTGDARARRTESTPDAETEKPWLPLSFTILALLASLGLNVYLGWLAWGFYDRYRTLAGQMRGAATI